MRKYHSEAHKKLQAEVRNKFGERFGATIHWYDYPELSDAYRKIEPDLMGITPKGIVVLIEIKTEFSEKKRDSEAVYKSVGQVLDYATVWLTENPERSSEDLRLFIVGTYHSNPLSKICQFLHRCGINIRHIALSNIPRLSL